MLNTERIFSWFCTISGQQAHEARQWLPLCESSARLVESRLREDVCTVTNMERLCMAAASVAHSARLSLAGGSGQIRVGDIALTSVAPGGGADTQCAPLLCHIADLLKPEGFAFVQTPEVKS